jgi:hypothetical protein
VHPNPTAPRRAAAVERCICRQEESGAGLPLALHCRDCDKWYGSEDDGYGPCTIKSQRGDKKPLTYGGHECDEGFDMVGGKVVAVLAPKKRAR